MKAILIFKAGYLVEYEKEQELKNVEKKVKMNGDGLEIIRILEKEVQT